MEKIEFYFLNQEEKDFALRTFKEYFNMYGATIISQTDASLTFEFQTKNSAFNLGYILGNYRQRHFPNLTRY